MRKKKEQTVTLVVPKYNMEQEFGVEHAERLLDMQIGVRRVVIDRSRFLCILHGEDVSVSTLCKVQKSMKCWEEAMSEMFVDEFSEWTVEHPNNQIGA